jgi:hypothetical protein
MFTVEFFLRGFWMNQAENITSNDEITHHSHLHKMGVSENPLWLACGLEENSAFHFVSEYEYVQLFQ